MRTKILLSLLLLAGLVAAVPCAYADGEAKTSTSSSGSSSGSSSLSPSDEQFLTDAAGNEFPGASDVVDPSLGDFLGDGSSGSGQQANVKYVYKGESEYMLRRLIKDDRIDDGYVQGLIRQRGPQ